MNQWQSGPALHHPQPSAADQFFKDRIAHVWINREIEGEVQPFTGYVTYHDPFHLILDNETMIDRKLIILIRMGE